MADDHEEPPALFDDDADTSETKTDEAADSNPFTTGDTTEITLDDGKPEPDDSSQDADKGTAEPDEEKSDLPTSAAASVDVTNLSKPSEEESQVPSKEKAEVRLEAIVHFITVFWVVLIAVSLTFWASHREASILFLSACSAIHKSID